MTLDTTGIDALLSGGEDHYDAWLRALGQEIVNYAKLSMNTSPAGRVYKRGTVTHVASQPNYPPNVDTGALRASLRVSREGRLWYTITDGVEYGYYLEKGTSKMRRRPFMVPAVEHWRNRIGEHAKRFGLVVKALR